MKPKAKEEEEDKEAKVAEAEAVDVQTHLLQTNLLKTQTTTLEKITRVFGPAMEEPPGTPPQTIKIGEESKEEATSQLQEGTEREPSASETV